MYAQIKSKKIKKVYLEFERKLENFKLAKFSIAVSGGIDSMALAFLAKCHSIKRKQNHLYFTVDHKLRSTSTKEAIQTKNIAALLFFFCTISLFSSKLFTYRVGCMDHLDLLVLISKKWANEY